MCRGVKLQHECYSRDRSVNALGTCVKAVKVAIIQNTSSTNRQSHFHGVPYNFICTSECECVRISASWYKCLSTSDRLSLTNDRTIKCIKAMQLDYFDKVLYLNCVNF